MDLHILAEDIAVPDPEVAFFAAIGPVLWGVPKGGPRMDLVVLPYFSPSRKIGVGHNPGSTADLHRPVHHHIRADIDIRVNCCAGINDSGRMNSHGRKPIQDGSSPSSSLDSGPSFSPGMRYRPSLQAPRSMSRQRSEQKGRCGFSSHDTSVWQIGQRTIRAMAISGRYRW